MEACHSALKWRNMLAEASTKDISEVKNPESYKESAIIVQQGGKIAGDARKQLEVKNR
jgi:hypothetical protein